MQHVIKKQIIDLRLDKQLDSFLLQQQVSDQFRESVLPVFENEFNKLAGEDEVISLERVEIDLGVISVGDIRDGLWHADLLAHFRKQFSTTLLEETGQQNGALIRRSIAGNYYKQWLFYMRNGYLPWNHMVRANQQWTSVLEELATDYQSIAELRDEIESNTLLVLRMIRQHDWLFLVRLVEVLTAEKQEGLLTILRKISSWSVSRNKLEVANNLKSQTGLSNLVYENIVFRILRSAVKPDRSFAGFIVELKHDMDVLINYKSVVSIGRLDAVSNYGLQEGEVITKNIFHAVSLPGDKVNSEILRAENESWKQVVEEESIFTSNAGLVLIHPFLSSLFKRMGLLAAQQFSGRAAQEKAIYLLHYVATGKTKAEEYELLVPKILCGYPATLPVAKSIRLSAKERKEADGMLKAAIASWDILKSTSITGLREGFLQRSGKVILKEGKISLLLEKHTIDVLLDHLPWSLSLIKLSWLDELIRVEWR